ncbi:MAG: carboxypeptidase-like regulatory domain-containing protein, partial [Candidatus Sulfotelmatobacter sp.]
MKNITHASPKRPLEVLKRAHMLVLIVLSGVIFAVPVFAQSFEAAKTERGFIRGTVVDTSDDPIPAATIVLQGPAGDRLTADSKDDGTFAFNEAPAGVAYQITVTAEGFADWSSSITVEPGQQKTLPEVKLRILAVQRAVTVSYSSKEVATQQLKAEEQQRIFRFIPN